MRGLKKYLPTALPPNALNNLQLLAATFLRLFGPQDGEGVLQPFHGFSGLFCDSSYSEFSRKLKSQFSRVMMIMTQKSQDKWRER